jgi:hypothetical protein
VVSMQTVFSLLRIISSESYSLLCSVHYWRHATVLCDYGSQSRKNVRTMVVAYFNVLPRNLSTETEEYHEKPHSPVMIRTGYAATVVDVSGVVSTPTSCILNIILQRVLCNRSHTLIFEWLLGHKTPLLQLKKLLSVVEVVIHLSSSHVWVFCWPSSGVEFVGLLSASRSQFQGFVVVVGGGGGKPVF